MTIEITLDEETRARLSELLDDDRLVTLVIHEPWTERRFEPGDAVRVPFDAGMGPATVSRHWRDRFGEEHVSITYGPRGKYHTNLHPSSVVTENVVRHPARIEVKSDD